jgi:hypothetical protein
VKQYYSVLQEEDTVTSRIVVVVDVVDLPFSFFSSFMDRRKSPSLAFVAVFCSWSLLTLEDHPKNETNVSRFCLFVVRMAAFSVFVLTSKSKKTIFSQTN